MIRFGIAYDVQTDSYSIGITKTEKGKRYATVVNREEIGEFQSYLERLIETILPSALRGVQK